MSPISPSCHSLAAQGDRVGHCQNEAESAFWDWDDIGQRESTRLERSEQGDGRNYFGPRPLFPQKVDAFEEVTTGLICGDIKAHKT